MAVGVVELAWALNWIKQRLSDPSIAAAGSLGIYAGQAADGSPLPGIIYGLQAGHDVFGAPAIRLMSSGLFYVRATGPSDDFAIIVAIAGAADAVLCNQGGTAINGTQVLQCIREQPIILDTLVNKVPYSTVGGLYRLETV